MNTCEAVALRIEELLEEKHMTLYKLEQESGILHGTMMGITKLKNKNITLKTVMQIAKGFKMTILEFLTPQLFTEDIIDLE